jgi:hypothetical protein
MKKSKFSEEQIFSIQKQVEYGTGTGPEACNAMALALK